MGTQASAILGWAHPALPAGVDPKDLRNFCSAVIGRVQTRTDTQLQHAALGRGHHFFALTGYRRSATGAVNDVGQNALFVKRNRVTPVFVLERTAAAGIVSQMP